jgi:hypothetical protein
MAQYKTGDIWKTLNTTDLLLITTNSMLNNKNELVMGKGIAEQAKDKYPMLPKLFGSLITPNSLYGVMTFDNWPTSRKLYEHIACFQTKINPFEKSTLDIIDESISVLNHLANYLPKIKFNLAYPGIGYGGLKEKDVKPLVDTLPDNVFIWKFS